MIRRIAGAVLLSVTMSAAVVAFTLLPLPARAENANNQDHMGKMPTSMAQLMKMDPEECMKMMDKEHKGHVTKKEFMKFQEELWKRMDKNKDGQADRAEFVEPPPG